MKSRRFFSVDGKREDVVPSDKPRTNLGNSRDVDRFCPSLRW
jgi:hypothetical protein